MDFDTTHEEREDEWDFASEHADDGEGFDEDEDDGWFVSAVAP